MEILISVVIPTYKRTALLYRCLSALSRQCFPPEAFEIIVVSDGPDPATAWLLDSAVPAGCNFVHIVLETKGGPAAARNAGWRRANGSLILFTDDDCVPDKDWLRRFFIAYEHHRQDDRQGRGGDDVAAAFRGSVIVPRPPRPTDYEKNTAGLETADFVTANCACTRLALEKTGGFDESFTMAWREDSDLEFRLFEHGIPILRISEARVIHPVRSAPWGVSMKEQKKSLFNALLYKKHPFLFRTRIYRRPFGRYYLITALAILAIITATTGAYALTLAAGTGWLLLTGEFARRRLTGTSRTPGHVAEMIVTSMIIPVLSIFWTLYGAVRYKTFFL
jgi:GT2 family glycosyltransferase